MTAKIKKWGNSAGIKIPQKIMKKTKLKLNSEIEIKYSDEKIIISPKNKNNTPLKDMVSKITKDNLNVLEDDYIPVGKEVW